MDKAQYNIHMMNQTLLQTIQNLKFSFIERVDDIEC
jgi:hypothetical protein